MNLLRQMPVAPLADFWFTEPASTFAPEVDSLFYLIYWISIVFFVIIIAAMVWFMIAYRRRPGVDAVKTATHNYTLELTWSVIPTLLIVVIFVKGFGGYLDMRTPPGETYDITVVAKRWGWTFIYPNGFIDTELHAPVNTPVKLILSSSDVIHSFFLRDMRVKMDVVPGRYTVAWFNATKAGKYELQCTEYCGRHHSDMYADVVIHEEGGFDDYLVKKQEEIDNMPPLELGKLLYEQRGCVQCHSLDGVRRVGPSFNQTWGNEHRFTDGTSAVGDREYIINSILQPQAQIRDGYQGVMPSFKGQLNDLQLNGLVGFIMATNPKYAEEAEKLFAKAPKKPGEQEGDNADQPQEGQNKDGGGQAKQPAPTKPAESTKRDQSEM